GEETLGRDIAARLSVRTAILSGATTIRELMAVVKRCGVLLTNDTGPMHIAAAFGVPVVAIFGPTDWRTTSPYGAEHALLRHPVECAPCMLREWPIDHRCMTGVTVEQVSQAGLSILSRRPDRPSDPKESRTQRGRIDPALMLEGYTIFLDRDGTLNEDPG